VIVLLAFIMDKRKRKYIGRLDPNYLGMRLIRVGETPAATRFDGKDHHVELWPKRYFISPGMMIEERGAGASLDINNVKIRRANTTRFLSLYLESRATPGISDSKQ
jgi:hypothetical protein